VHELDYITNRNLASHLLYWCLDFF